MSLMSDPLAWAKKAAKSRRNMILSMAAQLFVTLWGIWILYEYIFLDNINNTLSLSSFLARSSIIFVAGIIIPCAYIYCIHRLLKIIELNEEDL